MVGRDGRVFSSLMNGQQYQAASFARWATEQADAYERAHPSTRLPFQRCSVTVRGGGPDARAVCVALDEAREAHKPLLLYFGRGRFDAEDKQGKKENKLSRKFEKGTLNSKTAEKQCGGWALLRFDLADEAHAIFARSLGVQGAPALLVWLPGEDAPTDLGRGVTGQGLAVLLKKHRPE